MSWFSFTSKGSDQASAATQRANGVAELCKQFPSAEPKELERFLKVKDGNVKAAAAHFTRSLEWRAATLPVDPRADLIVRQLLTNRVVYELPGNAIDGSAVVVCHGPNHKPDDFAKEDTVRAFVYVAATIFERRPADQRWTLLVYAPGGTPVDLKALSAFAGTFKENFPETLAKVVVFPTSPLTPYLWNMCKVFLGKRTARKVVLLPGGKKPPRLKEFVPVDITPSLFLAADADGVPIPKSQKQRPGEPELLPRLADFTAEKGASAQGNGARGSGSFVAAEENSSGSCSSSSSGSKTTGKTATGGRAAAAENDDDESAGNDEELHDLARARKRALSSRKKGEKEGSNEHDRHNDDKGGGSGGGGGGSGGSSSGSSSGDGSGSGATERGYEDAENSKDDSQSSSHGESNGNADNANDRYGGGRGTRLASMANDSNSNGDDRGSLADPEKESSDRISRNTHSRNIQHNSSHGLGVPSCSSISSSSSRSVYGTASEESERQVPSMALRELPESSCFSAGSVSRDAKEKRSNDGLDQSLAAWVAAVVGSTASRNDKSTSGGGSSSSSSSGSDLAIHNNGDCNDDNDGTNDDDGDDNAQSAWAAVVGNIACLSGCAGNMAAPEPPASAEAPSRSRSHSPATSRSAATATSDLSSSTSTMSSSAASSPAHSADNSRSSRSSSSTQNHRHHDESFNLSSLSNDHHNDLRTGDVEAAPARGSPYSASRYEDDFANNSSSFVTYNQSPASRDFQPRACSRQRRASRGHQGSTSSGVEKCPPPGIKGSPLDSVVLI